MKGHRTGGGQADTPGGGSGGARFSHLVVWVRVGPAAGAVKPEEVLTVFVQTVDLVLLLKHTHRRSPEARQADGQQSALRVPQGVDAALTGESLH